MELGAGQECVDGSRYESRHSTGQDRAELFEFGRKDRVQFVLNVKFGDRLIGDKGANGFLDCRVLRERRDSCDVALGIGESALRPEGRQCNGKQNRCDGEDYPRCNAAPTTLFRTF